MKFTISPFSRRVVQQLPFDVQCIIIKFMLINYFSPISHHRFFNHRRPMIELPLLFGFDGLLDSIIVSAIQEMGSFAVTDLKDPCFDQFAKFVVSKSIKVKLLIGPIDQFWCPLPREISKFMVEPSDSGNVSHSMNLSDNVLEMLKSPFTKVVGAIDRFHPGLVNNYLKFVTSLEGPPSSIAHLKGDLKISRLSRLNHIKLLINRHESDLNGLSVVLGELRLLKDSS
ncbi:unnamed protein product [Ambrosiozyma monospora]|uniref:Unnamed protein product n=1 Tax=Ambrosiozyma monospora TaxID=43982 RepID=A0ACB5TC03_AMBMO|nr:unnamed protein product [Ambrosiozyma monospora]